MDSPSNLLQKIRAGSMALDDIEPDSFEDLIVEIVRQDYKAFGSNVNITRDRKYDVDLVIREQNDGPMSSSSDIHFIEAKWYKSNLSLDTTAKAYCAAIRYNPRTLTIACKSSLQPQPLEYGRALFGGAQGTQLFILNVKNSLNLKDKQHVDDVELAEVKPALFELGSWRLWKHTPFTSELVYGSEDKQYSISLSSQNSYSLVFYVEHFANELLPDYRIQWLEKQQEVTAVIRFGNIVRIETNLDLSIGTYPDSEVTLTAELGPRKTVEVISLPNISIARSIFSLPDLRSSLTGEIASLLRSSDGPHILIIGGEGGVGKTFLCEQVAESLKEQQFRCSNITIDASTTYLTFKRLILSLLFPANMERSEGGEHERDMVNAILKEEDRIRLLPDDEGGQLGVDINLEITMAARLVARSSKPHAIFISNCQYLQPEQLRGIRALFAALDQFGWNQCRIICEYRNPANSDLASFENAILRDRMGRAQKLIIEPLTEDEIHSSVERIFPDDEIEFVSSKLLEITGGNPFFLTQFLRSCLNKGFIATKSNGYIIQDHANFYQPVDLASDSAAQLLDYRLEQLDTLLLDVVQVPFFASQILGLSAVIGGRLNDLLEHVAELDNGLRIKVIAIFEDEGIITKNLGEGNWRFTHEFLKEALILRLSKVESPARSMSKAISLLSGTSANDSELRGRVYLNMGYKDEALKEFNQGYEVAYSRKQDFWIQKRCLLGITNIYRNSKPSGKHDRLLHVDILEKLGWAEHNSGSSNSATKIYQEALDLVHYTRPDSEIWTAEFISRRTAALSHAQLGLILATLEVGAIESRTRTAIDASQDLTRLGKILNRLVRLCTLLGYAKHGQAVSKLACKFSGESKDREVIAVLATDIGDLYLHSQPDISLSIRRIGCTRANEPRQQLHNDFCDQVSNLFATKIWSDEEVIKQLLSRSRSLGIRNIEVRIALYRGVHAIAEENLSVAKMALNHARQLALLSGSQWLLLLITNNLLILSLITGDKAMVSSYLGHVSRVVSKIIKNAPSMTVMEELIRCADKRCNLLSKEAKQEQNEIEHFSETSIDACGNLNAVISNLLAVDPTSETNENFREHLEFTGGVSGWCLLIESHPLNVSYQDMSLLLVLE